jgi:hypothetical protein
MSFLKAWLHYHLLLVKGYVIGHAVSYFVHKMVPKLIAKMKWKEEG